MEYNLPENLKKLRTERGLTQVELGKKVHLPQAYISHVESGLQSIPIFTAISFAEFFGVTLDELILKLK